MEFTQADTCGACTGKVRSFYIFRFSFMIFFFMSVPYYSIPVPTSNISQTVKLWKHKCEFFVTFIHVLRPTPTRKTNFLDSLDFLPTTTSSMHFFAHQ